MWILGQIPVISVSVKYVGPEKQDAPNLLYLNFNANDTILYLFFCILQSAVEVKNTEGGFS